jgi:hypothetical protein
MKMMMAEISKRRRIVLFYFKDRDYLSFVVSAGKYSILSASKDFGPAFYAGECVG